MPTASDRSAAAAGLAADQPPTAAAAAVVGGRSLPLYSPTDQEHLSPLVCLMRSQLEIFSATAGDVAERAAIGGISQQITPGRVGIRCVHCKSGSGHTETRPTAGSTGSSQPQATQAKGSTSYPTSLRILHQVSERDVCLSRRIRITLFLTYMRACSPLLSFRSHDRSGRFHPLPYQINRPSGTGRVSCDAKI